MTNTRQYLPDFEKALPQQLMSGEAYLLPWRVVFLDQSRPLEKISCEVEGFTSSKLNGGMLIAKETRSGD